MDPLFFTPGRRDVESSQPNRDVGGRAGPGGGDGEGRASTRPRAQGRVTVVPPG
jgi:hypothetical protein